MLTSTGDGHFVIRCDTPNCFEVRLLVTSQAEFIPQSAEAAMELAQGWGWKIETPTACGINHRDYCPKCKAKSQKENKGEIP